MGFWSRVADFARRRSGDSDDRLWGEWAGGGQSNAGVPVNSITAMRHVACMACVSILACDVAKIPFDIYRRLPDGGKEVFKDHPLHRLMRHPNNWQTAFEFKEMLQASLVLRGNGYAPVVRNGRGDPLYLVPVHPDRVGLFEAPSGEYFYAVTRNGLPGHDGERRVRAHHDPWGKPTESAKRLAGSRISRNHCAGIDHAWRAIFRCPGRLTRRNDAVMAGSSAPPVTTRA